jgi:deoxyribodipyrimidine photo-lyase
MRVLIWFHRDLRTHDHEGLSWALAQGHEVTAIAFRPRPASRARLQFWQETLDDLAASLKTANIPLTISEGSPSDVIPAHVTAYRINRVITHHRTNAREQTELDRVAKAVSVGLTQCGDLTLFGHGHASELRLGDLRPFTKFKNAAMASWQIPIPLPRPGPIQLAALPASTPWSAGGEAAALARLQDYIWETRACLHYHDTRNGMIQRDDSSKFSRWLATGALSPRLLYQELKKLKDEVGASPGVDALIYELVWRDYFKFLALTTGQTLFSRQGLRPAPLEIADDPSLIEAWRRGETGEDFADANLRELRDTGWMSNRGRQNVASFFSKWLHLDWTLGAQWFEAQLVDEDPENNWGNWQYIAGAGTDPRDRRFDLKRQATVYDPTGDYQQLWLSKTRAIEERIMELLRERRSDTTICPSEVLSVADKQDKSLMEDVRSAARRLCNKGLIEVHQKGVKVDPYSARGPIRLKLK